MRLNDRVRTPDGTANVVSVEPIGPPQPVWNLEIHGTHTYHADATGILVHNSGICNEPSSLRFYNNKYVGTKAVTSPHLPADPKGYCALIVDNQVYIARFHTEAWKLAKGKGLETFYGFGSFNKQGMVTKLWK